MWQEFKLPFSWWKTFLLKKYKILTGCFFFVILSYMSRGSCFYKLGYKISRTTVFLFREMIKSWNFGRNYYEIERKKLEGYTQKNSITIRSRGWSTYNVLSYILYHFSPHLFYSIFSLFVKAKRISVNFCFYHDWFRWIKFEEDVEEGGNRWSKPHVATLSLHALFELRSFILNGVVMLDTEANSLEQVTDLMLDNMLSCSLINFDSRDKVSKNSFLQM